MVASYLSGTSDTLYLGKIQRKAYVRSSIPQKKTFIESFIKGFKNVVTGEETLDIERYDPEVLGFVLRIFWSYGWYAKYDFEKRQLFVSERIDQVEISDIKVYGKYNATCITVDRSEGLFLTTNYLVTHNSAIMSSFLARNATMTYNLGHNVIGSSKEDLASIAEYLEFGLDNVHPFLKINRTGNNWEKEVIMGNRMITGERDVHARIKIINVEGTSKGGSSLKTAGSTPYTSIYDEVGKYPFLGAYLAGRPSHMMHGKMRGMILSAGCVCAGSMVYKANGEPCNIENLKQEDGILGYNLEKKCVSIEQISWMKPPSPKPCYRITTSRGRVIECSNDHPILCVISKRNGEYRYYGSNFIRADKIKPRRRILLAQNADVWGTKQMKDPYLVGLLVGDGSYGIDHSVRIYSKEYEVYDYLRRNYDIRVTEEHPTKEGEVLRYIVIYGACSMLRELGIYGQTKMNKTLPLNMNSYRREDVVSLLRGYFDADSTMYCNLERDKCNIAIYSCTRKILDEVKILLEKLGIFSKIMKSKSRSPKDRSVIFDGFLLRIADRFSIENFYREIGTNIEYRKVKMLQSIEWLSRRKGGRYRSKHLEGFNLEVVKSVEYIGIKNVYNLTTSNTHTYLVNGIITHNTGGNVERSQDAQKVMNDPAKYHFIIMDYDLLNKHTVNPTWRICKSGCFVPGQMSHAYEKKKITLAEYLDKPKSTLLKKIPIEVTDFDKNTKVIRDRLNELANGDRELYIQEKMAYPLTIDDCFLNTNVNRFPIEDAAKHKNELLENGRVGKVVDVYKLAGNKMGQNYSDKPVAPYPFKGGNIDCPVVIYEDPPEDGGNFNFTYASGCLLPGERVLTDTGLKPVETVDFSDRLVNMEGEYVEINTLLRYKKKDVDVYTLTMGNGLSKTSFTEEHPIYAASQVKRNHRTREDLFKFSFKKVSEVKETDWVRYPNLYAKEWDITPYMGMFKDLADNIDFWWIAGYYVGNGYTQAGRNVIGFALCIEETAVIERLKRIIREIFQKTPHLVLKKRKEGGKGAEINFSCMEYYTWLFTTFGKYALKKRIPEHIKHLDKDCKVSFLQGYLDSDGHLSVHTKGYFGMEYVSANLPLLEDIQDMFLSIGMPGNITKLRDSGTAVILGVVSRQKACYHLRIGDNHTNEFCEWAKRLYPDGSRKINKATGLVSRGKRHKKDCFISEDRRYIYFQIKKIEKSKYTGMVCNFDCETHTYLCHHITTHNCDPYKAEKADTDSLGAFYIFKRAVNINDPYGNRIVASYAARPASSDDFCRTCETLIEAYGAKCLMENADRIFELYLARQGKDQYLLEDGEALANRIIRPGARQNNRLGLAPTPINQRMLFSAVLQYCWEEVVVDVDQFGNEITQLGIYRIDDVELLEEIIAFGHGVNTDRIIAFGHALLLARYYDDMNYMPESSTAKKNAQIRDMLKCRQAIGFASNPANKGFVSRSSILNR
jgi:intein/homing endonuclease